MNHCNAPQSPSQHVHVEPTPAKRRKFNSIPCKRAIPCWASPKSLASSQRQSSGQILGLEVNADIIRPGDSLAILPIDGALHTITSGDTLGSIASDYEVTVDDIINYPGNNLADANAPLTIASKLVIPNGVKPFVNQQAVAYTSGAAPANARIGGGNFVWPTAGSINQRYWGGHAAVDLGAWTGAPVKAADGGYVALATGGWNGGYGNHIIIDHGNGFVTLYAHLNSIFVKPGESVAAGQQIGSVGNTGNSTGPHLHFEIRYQGVPRDPLDLPAISSISDGKKSARRGNPRRAYLLLWT